MRHYATTPNRALTSRATMRAFGWLSLALGLSELFFPRALCRALGLPGRAFLLQAYGLRELAAGAAILSTHDHEPAMWMRSAGDVLDVLTVATTPCPRGAGSKRFLLLTTLLSVTVADVLSAKALHDQKRLAPANRFDYSDRSGFPTRRG